MSCPDSRGLTPGSDPCGNKVEENATGLRAGRNATPPFDWILKANQEDTHMRFMIIVKATRESEAGVLPSAELLTAMGKYNEDLIKAGVMMDGAGLQSSAKGARVRFAGDSRMVIDGPFAETKELIAGYWIFNVESKQEAIEWVKRAPNPHNGDSEIEVRQLFENSDFE